MLGSQGQVQQVGSFEPQSSELPCSIEKEIADSAEPSTSSAVCAFLL